jgi:hypothetical protein
MIDNLAHPTTCILGAVVKGNNQMEVGKGIVYPHMVLDDVWIDSYENAKNLKLEVPLDDMMLKL